MEIERVQASGITKRYEFMSSTQQLVKAAYVQRPEKHIICLSTQIGCVGHCKFCSAGDKQFIRNLTAMEMISMVNLITSLERVTMVMPLLVSFMGTGEPLSNLDEVLRTIEWLTKSTRFAISTSGCRLERIVEIPSRVKLQFTLVSVDHNVRRELQPHADSLDTLGHYAERYTGPKEFSVPLISGINDNFRSMEAIAMFSSSLGSIPVKLNRFHEMRGFQAAGVDKAQVCMDWLGQYGIRAEYYETDGEDILAACGQFEET